MDNYLQKLRDDLPQQFREKPKIDGLLKAIAKQLNDLSGVLESLKTDRNIHTATGRQLDGIGSIVGLSREEASALSSHKSKMDDETYRKWLKYKISINSSKGTYSDIKRAIALILGDKFIRYKELLRYPATAIFDITDLQYEDVLTVSLLQKIKAAGVLLSFVIYDLLQKEIYLAGGVSSFQTDRFYLTSRASPALSGIHIGRSVESVERLKFSFAFKASKIVTEIYKGTAISEKQNTQINIKAKTKKPYGLVRIHKSILTNETSTFFKRTKTLNATGFKFYSASIITVERINILWRGKTY